MRYLFLLMLMLVSCKKEITQPTGMILIQGGTFLMGSADAEYPDETPVHEVTLKSFYIDEAEVTNAQFAEFVRATHYVTYAERDAKKEDFPQEALKDLPAFPFHQGALVFSHQWQWQPDANWQHPEGKESSIVGKENHPVVCVTHDDALAYATWAGKRLPTEAEWEYAARGGLVQKRFTWGDAEEQEGKYLCNNWQGHFPEENTSTDGYTTTSPVKSFPPNSYQLYDMAGNVWEHCADYYDPSYYKSSSKENPVNTTQWTDDAGALKQGAENFVIRGGSFLCARNYCHRYRPAARESQDKQSPTNHCGFRCVKDLPQ